MELLKKIKHLIELAKKSGIDEIGLSFKANLEISGIFDPGTFEIRGRLKSKDNMLKFKLSNGNHSVPPLVLTREELALCYIDLTNLHKESTTLALALGSAQIPFFETENGLGMYIYIEVEFFNTAHFNGQIRIFLYPINKDEDAYWETVV